MPDGTIIKNVPEGTTKAQLVEKLQRNGYNVPQEWLAPQPDTRDPNYVIPDGRFQGMTRAQLEAELDRINAASGSVGARVRDAALYYGGEAARTIGRVGKNVAQGALALPAMVMDVPAAAFNAGSAALGSDTRAPMLFTGAAGGMDEMFPPLAPRNGAERFVDRASQALTGAATGIGVGGSLIAGAGPVASRVGNTLVQNPGIQGISAVTGTAGAEGARQAGAGDVGQLAAGLAGAMAPTATVAGGAASMRGVVRGGEAGRQQLERNVADFGRLGTTPTVGQGTEGRVQRAIESLLSRAPGGAGPLSSRGEGQARELGDAIEARAAQLMGRTSGEQAGRQIERSIRGPGGFIENWRAAQKRAYDALDEFIPGDRGVDVRNTMRVLAELNEAIPHAGHVSGQFRNSRLASIQHDLMLDVQSDSLINQPGFLPYEALKKLRTLVGNEMSEVGLVSDVPKSKWKALYAALSTDLENAAAAAGPKARGTWERANTITRAGMARIEKLESVIDRNGGPEAVFRAAMAGTREGASTLRAVMQSVDDTGRKMISATVLRRMGLAKPGAQNELGDQFSTETFLTNWNSLSKEAKSALFDRFGNTFREDMDSLARVAANLRSGSQVFRNPSGTAQATTQAATAGAFAMALLTGRVGTAAMIAGGVGAGNVVARAMTNPKFVRWLAQATKVPRGAYGAKVNQLAQWAKASGDEDLARMAALLEQVEDSPDQ
jgi:hypothetical protein